MHACDAALSHPPTTHHSNTGSALASAEAHAGPYAQPPTGMPRFAAAGLGQGVGQGLVQRIAQRQGAGAPLIPGAAGALAPFASLPSASPAGLGQQHTQTGQSHHHSSSHHKGGSATLGNAAKLAKVRLASYSVHFALRRRANSHTCMQAVRA